MGALAAFLGLLGTGIKAIFGFKEQQANAVQAAVKLASDVNATSGQREAAIAQIIAAEAGSGYWLAACIRPLILLNLLIIIDLFIFGHAPAALLGSTLPPLVVKIFDLLELGLGGYIGARTLEKVITQINIASILKAFLAKKLL